MDGRRQPASTWLAHLQTHSFTYQVCILILIWVTCLYMAGPHLGILFIALSAFALFYCAHKYGTRTQSAGGYSFLNPRGRQALGEMRSEELEGHVRGVARGGRLPGAHFEHEDPPAGKALGGGAVPSKNAVLAALAAERAARHRAHADAAPT